MTKQILEKITKDGNFLQISDISVEEKKSLMFFLASKGFTISTFYLRFFQKGFSEWEINGIDSCKKAFLELPEVAEPLLAYVDSDDPDQTEGNRGYFYILAHSDEPGRFYECLRKVNGGLCNKFIQFMDGLGMSQNTTIKRFKEENWKPWELQGIKSLLESFCSQGK